MRRKPTFLPILQLHCFSRRREKKLIMETKTLQVIQNSPSDPLAYLYLNRPARHNALSLDFFSEFPAALSLLDQNPAVRVIVLSARGSSFCSGIDLSSISTISSPSDPSDPARVREHLRRHILFLQSAISAIERCRKPVIAEIDGACIGAGVDLVTACDVRYCTDRAVFSVKEVDLAITADLGTLQRLPRVVGFGNAMEMALTGRKVLGKEAKEMGLVSRVFGSRTEMEEGVRAIAEDMATKSPLAVVGTKAVLLRSRDLTVEQGLDYVAAWNSAMLLSDDLKEAMAAHINKRKPTFSKL